MTVVPEAVLPMLALLVPASGMFAFLAMLTPPSPHVLRSSYVAMRYNVHDNSAFGMASEMYERDPNDVASVDVARVEDLIAERIDCRYARDFEGADAIRAELKQSHGVIVNDRERLWFVDNGRRVPLI